MKIPHTRYAGRFLNLFEIDGWEYVSRSNATGVVVLIAVTERDELVLVEQFRSPIGGNVIELPAGLVGDHADPDESMLVAARRELLEETGFVADKLEIGMTCPSSAGLSDEQITFVMAYGLKRVAEGGGDSSEDIVVHLVSLETVDRWIEKRRATGTPSDPKVFSALYWLNRRDKAAPDSTN